MSNYDQATLDALADKYIEEEALAEIQEEGRSSLLGYTQITFPRYKADRFHQHLANQLDRVVTGEFKELGYRGIIISAPPQHGKSELVSVRLPAYWLSKRPDDPVILTSYSAKLAVQKSKKARELINSPTGHFLFPDVLMKRDSRAGDYWELAGHSGYLLAGGVDGSLTGFGAMLAIVDDPFKSWAEAQSKTIRDKVWEWYEGTFITRLAENGIIILMATRWNEDDLSGRLLEREPNKWLILRYAALSEGPNEDILQRPKGVALAPSRYSAGYLSEIRDTVAAVVWLAEYQQSPTAPEGTFFRTNEIQYIDHEDLPTDLIYRIRYWDLAGTALSGSNDPDYAVGSLVSVRFLQRTPKDPNDQAELDEIKRLPRVLEVFIEDQIRVRGSPGEIEGIVSSTAKKDGTKIPIWIEQEGGSSGKTVIYFYKKLLPNHQVNGDPPTGEKLLRATPLATALEHRHLYLVRGAWNTDLVAEMQSAPNGKHDDTWDSASGALNKLNLTTKKKARTL